MTHKARPQNNHLLTNNGKMVKEHPHGKPYAVEIKNENTRRNDAVTWYATAAEAAASRDSFNATAHDHLFAVAYLCVAMPDHPAFATPNRRKDPLRAI